MTDIVFHDFYMTFHDQVLIPLLSIKCGELGIRTIQKLAQEWAQASSIVLHSRTVDRDH